MKIVKAASSFARKPYSEYTLIDLGIASGVWMLAAGAVYGVSVGACKAYGWAKEKVQDFKENGGF